MTMSNYQDSLEVTADPQGQQIRSVRLFGAELLDAEAPCASELLVNGRPLTMRPHTDPNQAGIGVHLKGECFTDHFSGWSLVLNREMGGRTGLKHPCFGIQSLVRRELCDQTVPCPGPGGPIVEAPLWADTLTLLGWNWKFWGDDTRLLFPSSHSSGPCDEWGHTGYENDRPAEVKKWIQNVWRRIYPGCLVIHGGLFYNAANGNWLALTCRRPNFGYVLNIESAGEGIAYDFTLHAPIAIGQSLRLPEIKLYYGPDEASMMGWLGDYVTHHLQEAPDWVHRTVWSRGLAWNNEATWAEQADAWEKHVESGVCSAIGYSLVTDRPIQSGTTPYSYAPDPNHGSQAEFRAMGQRLAEKSIPWLVWMSHSGLAAGGDEVDEDWFIRGIDGRTCAAWGNIDSPSLVHINPGHPGYIEYTKKWMRFYIEECGASGIFFDCLSWAFPPDYTPRSWMRYPGDTNRMAVRFMDEIAAYLRQLDPEAILLGEGTSVDFPVHVFSVHTNPKRAADGMGPRDWFLALNRFAPKKLVIDQGPDFNPASGMAMMLPGTGNERKNRALTKILREKGGRGAWTPLADGLSLLEAERILVVPSASAGEPPLEIRLPAPWGEATRLVDLVDEGIFELRHGVHSNVPPGIYRLE
jgi:hypothetical protein